MNIAVAPLGLAPIGVALLSRAFAVTPCRLLNRRSRHHFFISSLTGRMREFRKKKLASRPKSLTLLIE
jgi:hypothetical protein